MMVVIDFNLALSSLIVNHRTVIGRGENTVNPGGKALFAVARAWLIVVNLVDIVLTQTRHLYAVDIRHVKVAVQGGGGRVVAIGFQFDLTVLPQAETGD